MTQTNKRGPGAPWVHTSPSEIALFRETYALSEAATARVLGVAIGTLRNWTLHGKTGTLAVQERAARSMQSYKPGDEKVQRPPSGRVPGSVIGEMVLSYMRQGGKVRGDLVSYVEKIKTEIER